MNYVKFWSFVFALAMTAGVSAPAWAVPSSLATPEGAARFVEDDDPDHEMEWEGLVIRPGADLVSFARQSSSSVVFGRITGAGLNRWGIQPGTGGDVRTGAGGTIRLTGGTPATSGGTLVIRPVGAIFFNGGAISVMGSPNRPYSITVLSVPEPHVLPLMVGGLMLIGFMVRRRQVKGG